MSHTRTTKVREIKPKKLKDSIFKSTSKVLEDTSDNALILKAIAEQKQQVEEQKILENEIKKPVANRNPAIIKKYLKKNIDGVIDGWPDITTGKKYSIVARAPEDPTVSINFRNDPYYIGVDIEFEENEYYFRFPFYKTDIPNLPYKLDYQDVYLDINYNVIRDEDTKYSLYELIKALRDGEYNYLENYEYERNGLIVDGKFNFILPGQNFSVSYTQLKKESAVKKPITNDLYKKIPDEVIEEKDSDDKVEEDEDPNKVTLEPTLEMKLYKKFKTDNTIYNQHPDYVTANIKIRDWLANNKHVLLGIPNAKFYPDIDGDNPLNLAEVYTVKTFAEPFFLFGDVDQETRKINVIAVNGVRVIKELTGQATTKARLVEDITKYNKAVYKQYLEIIGDINSDEE